MVQQIEITLKPKRRGFHLVTSEILSQLPKLPKTGIVNIFKGFRACSCIAINCRECLCFMMRLFIQKGTYTLRPMNGNSVIKKKIAPIFLFI